MSKKNKIFYYPYSSIRDIGTAKRALLYFDEIYFLDPWRARPDGLAESTQSDWDNLIGHKKLKETIKLIHPHEYIHEDQSIIAANVQDDMESKDFLNLCQPYLHQTWKIAESKIPESFEQDTRLRQLLFSLPNYVQSAPHTMPAIYDQMVEEGLTMNEIREYAQPSFGEERQAVYSRYHTMIEEREESEHASMEFRVVKVPFPVGESLMVNHALCILKHHSDLIPFTDDSLHDKFLRLKYKKLADQQSIRHTLVGSNLLSDAKKDLVAMKILTSELPDVGEAHIDDILELREKRNTELQSFRINIAKVAADIESNEWSDKFEKEIKLTIDKYINPELDKLKASFRSLSGAKWQWLAGAGSSVMSLSGIPLVFSIFPAMPISLIIAAGAGFYALDKYFEFRREREKLRANGVALLYHSKRLSSAQ